MYVSVSPVFAFTYARDCVRPPPPPPVRPPPLSLHVRGGGGVCMLEQKLSQHWQQRNGAGAMAYEHCFTTNTANNSISLWVNLVDLLHEVLHLPKVVFFDVVKTRRKVTHVCGRRRSHARARTHTDRHTHTCARVRARTHTHTHTHTHTNSRTRTNCQARMLTARAHTDNCIHPPKHLQPQPCTPHPPNYPTSYIHTHIYVYTCTHAPPPPTHTLKSTSTSIHHIRTNKRIFKPSLSPYPTTQPAGPPGPERA